MHIFCGNRKTIIVSGTKRLTCPHYIRVWKFELGFGCVVMSVRLSRLRSGNCNFWEFWACKHYFLSASESGERNSCFGTKNNIEVGYWCAGTVWLRTNVLPGEREREYSTDMCEDIGLQKVQNNAARLILKAPKTDHINLIFALCTGFQSILESNVNFVLFVLVLSLLLVLSIFPICSRFTHSLGNPNLLQTSVHTKSYCERSFSYTAPTLGTHFRKTSNFLSQLLPLAQHSRFTFF